MAVGDVHVTVETFEATSVPATSVFGQSCRIGGSTSVDKLIIYINSLVNNQKVKKKNCQNNSDAQCLPTNAGLKAVSSPPAVLCAD